MTRSELVKKLHDRQQHLMLKDVNHIVDLMFDEITNALVRGQRVEFRRFGAFITRHHKERIARNPSSGKTLRVGAKRVPGFRMGKALRENLNATMDKSKLAL